MKKVDFYYSLGSRYSYLAFTQIEALTLDTGCQVEYLPVDGGSLISRRDMNPFAGKPVSGQYDWGYRELDAKRWAAFYGVPYVEPRGRVTFDSRYIALAAVAAKRLGRVVEFSGELFSAMFCEPDIAKIDRQECVECARRCGIPESEFARELDSEDTIEQHAQSLQAAHTAGVFGIPSFVAGSELFWGNDRLVLLRDYLRRSGKGPDK
jgi:2-hydroxychromene-2-carboxylate isomerase